MSTERVISVEFVAIGIGKIIQTTACGLFALAFATALCAGEDPQYLHFNTEGTYMRDHLLQCLENGVIQPFTVQKVCYATLYIIAYIRI